MPYLQCHWRRSLLRQVRTVAAGIHRISSQPPPAISRPPRLQIATHGYENINDIIEVRNGRTTYLSATLCGSCIKCVDGLFRIFGRRTLRSLVRGRLDSGSTQSNRWQIYWTISSALPNRTICMQKLTPGSDESWAGESLTSGLTCFTGVLLMRI